MLPPAGNLRRSSPELSEWLSNTQDSAAAQQSLSGQGERIASTEDHIHTRIQQRNGSKTLAAVQGIADDYDKKKLVKVFKKKSACNGTVIEHPEYGEVIQLQGDQCKNICQFLVEAGLAESDQLEVHRINSLAKPQCENTGHQSSAKTGTDSQTLTTTLGAIPILRSRAVKIQEEELLPNERQKRVIRRRNKSLVGPTVLCHLLGDLLRDTLRHATVQVQEQKEEKGTSLQSVYFLAIQKALPKDTFSA
ncbi:hypothetical protein MC885_004637 [Smutsia gigantea]|nr:hypothetical protein MC885_004637 [Smutsia gigantea]